MGNKGTRITFDEKLHGANVSLSKGGVVASRVNKSTAVDTIAYVEQEVPKGVKVEIRVEEKTKQTEGSMVSVKFLQIAHICSQTNEMYLK